MRVIPEAPGTSAADLLAFALQQLPADTSLDLRELRARRRVISERAKHADARQVIDVALALHEAAWSLVAFELVGHHRAAQTSLTLRDVERFGSRMSDWGSVDAFGSLLAGPAWLAGAIVDQDVLAWAGRDDRWWRRAALVATTVLNTKSRGGSGDTARTLLICVELVDDRDDLVVKAESWALRALSPWDPSAVVVFLERHDDRLAARVKREVGNKLRTGKKSG